MNPLYSKLKACLFRGHLPALLIMAISCGTHVTSSAKVVVAFPGAEGFGRLASGGRGGDVYEVKTLEDFGLGSSRRGFPLADVPRKILLRQCRHIPHTHHPPR